MPAPRGTAIQIGNLPGARTVSAKAQLDATAARLRAAEASGDPNEMLAALQASTSLDLPDGVAMTPELQKLTATMRQRIGAEPELRALDALRRSRAVKTKVRRLWELMVSESAQIEMSEGRTPTVAGPGEEDTVTRTGYMALHIRVAKTLIAAQDFNREEAEGISDSDWAEDISKFSGTSHIMVWLDEIRTKFKEAAAQAVALHGFTGLFARCELSILSIWFCSQFRLTRHAPRSDDTDGSGELDTEEFFAAVRNDLAIGVDTITDTELESLFKQVDVDGGGEVDAEECARPTRRLANIS